MKMVHVEFFLDSAIIEEIESIHELGFLDGVTTNPSLIANSGRKFTNVIRDICSITDKPVSAEVLSLDYENMLNEAEKLAEIAPNVVIKLPLTFDGLKVVHLLSKKNVPTNVTLCFSVNQALMAAKSGATYISPFIGRLDDVGQDGIAFLESICSVYEYYNLDTKVLAASIRHPLHVQQAAIIGADVATLPYKTMKDMIKHPLTDVGIERFLEDSKKFSW